MLTEDYLIRMINLAIAALLRLVGLKKAGLYEEAQQLIDLTFERLLGLRAHIAKNLEDERLYYLLTNGDRLDTRRLSVVAELFCQEGDVLAATQRLEESRVRYARGLKYFLEVFFNQEGDAREETRWKIAALLPLVPLPELPVDTLWPLAGFLEESGAYASTEQALLELVERPDTREAVLPELIAFYQRLSGLTDRALAQGGLDHAAVSQRMARWSA